MRKIFIIRHGEKPPGHPHANGVDIEGNRDAHSLVPIGWQRAGALNTLFAPYDAAPRNGLAQPTQLFSPDYGSDKSSAGHRPYETILPLSKLLHIEINTTYDEGKEAKLAEDLAAGTTGVALVCWEHNAIIDIARSIPLLPGPQIPRKWPDDRFDLVWCFELDAESREYSFTQVPQKLLAGDQESTIGP
jgi:hypothetical protein